MAILDLYDDQLAGVQVVALGGACVVSYDVVTSSQRSEPHPHLRVGGDVELLPHDGSDVPHRVRPAKLLPPHVLEVAVLGQLQLQRVHLHPAPPLSLPCSSRPGEVS